MLGQLGNRVQHALRAFTPRDQKAVKAAADTFRRNPAFDTAEVIMQLGVGEALLSMLDDKGSPHMVERALIAPPSARVGPITPAERAAVAEASPLLGKYDTTIDRESAFEILQKRARPADAEERQCAADRPSRRRRPPAAAFFGQLGGMLESALGGGGATAKGGRARMSTGEMVLRSAAQSAARSVGTQITRAILRGVLGGISK